MSAQAVRALRKIVKRPAIEEGTIVRFSVRYEMTIYPYAHTAIFIGGAWYSSAQHPGSTLRGGGAIRPKMEQAEFEQVLRSPQVSAVAVATEWEEL